MLGGEERLITNFSHLKITEDYNYKKQKKLHIIIKVNHLDIYKT